jgi:opacity protein-like surface antigen
MRPYSGGFMRQIVMSVAFLLLSGLPCFANITQVPDDNVPTLREIGILSGYGSTKVTDKDRYVTVPVFLRFGLDCDKFGLGFSDWVERGARDFFHADFRPAGRTEFFIEPFASYVPSPDQNMEGGFIIAFKYDWPLTEKFHPYIWNGGGVMYTSQHLREERTQWNFTPQMGGGFSYFLSKNKALNVEYRYRHSSNANLSLPNDGVNEGFFTAGLSWFY